MVADLSFFCLSCNRKGSMQYFIKLFNLLNRTIKTKKEISMAVITAPVTAEVTSTHVSSMLYYRHTAEHIHNIV